MGREGGVSKGGVGGRVGMSGRFEQLFGAGRAVVGWSVNGYGCWVLGEVWGRVERVG